MKKQEAETATLFAVYESQFANNGYELETLPVVRWGSGWKAIGQSGLAFRCRTRFALEEHAQSEREALDRFKNLLQDRIKSAQAAVTRDKATLLKLTK